jgi:hypothetical protein
VPVQSVQGPLIYDVFQDQNMPIVARHRVEACVKNPTGSECVNRCPDRASQIHTDMNAAPLPKEVGRVHARSSLIVAAERVG